MNTENIKDYIYDIYMSDMHDIDDLSEIIEIINNNILKNKNDPDFLKKHDELIKLRLFTKKLLVSKARQGHDFHYIDAPPKCKEGELARSFVNVEECKSQYNEFLKYVWIPSSASISDKCV